MTIVELMIAMLIGLLLLLGTTSLFVSNKRISREQNEMGYLQENARFATDFMMYDLRMADFLGCIWNPTVPNPPVSGTEGGGATPDQITVRFVGTTALADTVDLSGASFDIAPGHGLQVNDQIAVVDCSGLELRTVTAITLGANPGDDDTITLDQTPDMTTGSLHRYHTRVYTISGSSLTLNGDQLIEGVENMQILYGVDTGADRIPDTYMTADNVTAGSNWDNVVGVKVALLFATVTPNYEVPKDDNTYTLLGQVIPAANDNLRRRVFNFSVQLRNRING